RSDTVDPDPTTLTSTRYWPRGSRIVPVSTCPAPAASWKATWLFASYTVTQIMLSPLTTPLVLRVIRNTWLWKTFMVAAVDLSDGHNVPTEPFRVGRTVRKTAARS